MYNILIVQLRSRKLISTNVWYGNRSGCFLFILVELSAINFLSTNNSLSLYFRTKLTDEELYVVMEACKMVFKSSLYITVQILHRRWEGRKHGEIYLIVSPIEHFRS